GNLAVVNGVADEVVLSAAVINAHEQCAGVAGHLDGAAVRRADVVALNADVVELVGLFEGVDQFLEGGVLAFARPALFLFGFGVALTGLVRADLAVEGVECLAFILWKEVGVVAEELVEKLLSAGGSGECGPGMD